MTSVKDKVLIELEAAHGMEISGRIIAQKLNISRNAVWKAISSLKSDGFAIISCPSKGYRLSGDGDAISKEGIRKYMGDKYRELPVYVFGQIDSTNNEAKRMVASGFSQRALLIADAQTEGRGRNGRSFYSPWYTGIYMSIILHPTNMEISNAVRITTSAAAAVGEAIEEVTGISPQIKWVNDIYINGQKACGILTEAISDFETGTVKSVIIGVGINVSTQYFPDEIRKNAVSLSPTDVTRNQLAAKIAENIFKYGENPEDRSYLLYYRKHSMVMGREIDYTRNGEVRRAIAVGIDETGGLIIRNLNGSTQVLKSGEISVRLAQSIQNRHKDQNSDL